MDDIDRAARREELDRSIALAQRQPEGPAAGGACLYCGDAVADGVRWCGADCRDDWQHQQQQRGQQCR